MVIACYSNRLDGNKMLSETTNGLSIPESNALKPKANTIKNNVLFKILFLETFVVTKKTIGKNITKV